MAEHEGLDHFKVVRSKHPDVHSPLIQSLTDAVQAQERLLLTVKEGTYKNEGVGLLQKVTETWETMRSMKADVESKSIHLTSPSLDETALQKLRSLMLMHLPRTLTFSVKQEFQDLIHKAFGAFSKYIPESSKTAFMQYDRECFLIIGTVCKVIYARLCWCPWYVSTQPELGQQAKHNSIFIVFANPDNYTFSPVNAHSKEQTEVIDLGWLYAAEVSHFARYLVKAKSRMVDAIFAPDSSSIISTDTWSMLIENLDRTALIGQQSFLEMCRGQAVGCLAKKSKVSGKMKLKPDVTLYQFCESFRLLQYAVNALTRQTLEIGDVDFSQLSATARDAQQLLTSIYQHEGDGRTKEDLFDMMMTMKGEVDSLLKSSKRTRAKIIEEQVGRWMKYVRVGDRTPVVNTGLSSTHRDHLLDLMKSVGGPVAKMNPENIVMIVRAGSYLYNLSTPESDVDYLVVYVEPTDDLLSKVCAPCENIENRGPNKQIEYGAYEVRLFAEMLLKGSVVISEIVYIGEAEFSSPSWQALCSESQLFVTEHVILQYLGLISNNMHDIKSNKHENEPKERKLFYQIFHKLWTLEYLLEGVTPPVKTSGEIHDFIMSIRRGPLEDELSRDKLYKMAEEKVQSVRRRLVERTTRLPEHADVEFLTDWILTVRGAR